ncbi:MAG: hypothetical protein Q9M25_10120 [Mariprofundaceae bacterium]|nr:hypothetical protein [Mariprofundaceae bacterium]
MYLVNCHRNTEKPAQQVLVERFLDWPRVEKRLEKFPHIKSCFPMEVLKNGINKPPYYCHYMAWRLGTWSDNCDNLFELFDKLLGIASELDNWKREFSSLQVSCDYAEFWSLLWQLQVASFFAQQGHVSWNPTGPDITVKIGDNTFYVECYTYRKSFAMENFIEELMRRIDGNICVRHQGNLPFKLPSDNARKPFLDKLFRPFLDPVFIENKQQEAQNSWPVYFPIPPDTENFCVYLEGPTDAYTYKSNAAGDSRNYLEDAIKKGVDAKRNSNGLKSHRPNILAINYLLSVDYQASCYRHEDMGEELPSAAFAKTLDAVLLSSCGINCELSSNGPPKIFTRWSREEAQKTFCLAGVNFVEGVS